MKVSLEWLQEWCELPSSFLDLADRLTRTGTEVISIQSTGCQIAGIVSAKITEKKLHPNADRLTLCTVNDGTSSRQVVCGAKNHNVGDIVPLALPGAVFPGGMTIKATKMRGESSEGMLCSAKEIGLAEDAEGLLILPAETKLGVPLQQLFPGETVFEVEITSNRPDLASMEGLARELGALGFPSKPRSALKKTLPDEFKGLKVQVADAKDCPYYTLTALAVQPGVESPSWIKKRLVACGMRSLGLLVDVTQYVMLEIGQPVHAFDADRLGKSTLEVRRAKAGEKMAGLDGGTHVLTIEDMVIANDSGVVALAGVVGGTQTAVHAGTTKILLESASFQAGRVRKTARRLSLPTESGRRFGRGGLDACLVNQASERVRQILHECGALTKEEGVTQVGSIPQAKEDEITLRCDRVEKILGLKMDPKEISNRLVALGFHARGDGWVPPPWRSDVREEIDLLEELIRLSDLDKVPSFLDPLAEGESAEDREDGERRQIRLFLVERGYFEVLGGSLIRADEGMSVQLSTGAGPEVGAYRESLLPGLLAAAARNISRGQTNLKLFEIGRVTGAKGREEMRLALLITGCEQGVSWQGGEVKSDLFSLKGIGQELAVRFGWKGEPITLREVTPAEKKQNNLKPRLWVAEFSLPKKAEKKAALYQEVSSFPGVERDFSLVLPEAVAFSEVEKVIRSAAPTEMVNLLVFDRFRDPSGAKVAKGFLSLGCRLQFRSTARTLTEQEVGGWEKKILESLATRCEAKLRGVL